MIPHIQMADNSIVIQLSTGPVTIGPLTYNYNTIRKLLPHTTNEEDICDLLKTPEYPYGVFYLYKYANRYIVQNHHNHGTDNYEIRDAIFSTNASPPPHDATLLGVYVSLDEIRNEYPELFI